MQCGHTPHTNACTGAHPELESYHHKVISSVNRFWFRRFKKRRGENSGEQEDGRGTPAGFLLQQAPAASRISSNAQPGIEGIELHTGQQDRAEVKAKTRYSGVARGVC